MLTLLRCAVSCSIPGTTGLLAAGSRNELLNLRGLELAAGRQDGGRRFLAMDPKTGLADLIAEATEKEAPLRVDKYAQKLHARIFEHVLSNPTEPVKSPALSLSLLNYMKYLSNRPSAVWTTIAPKALSALVVLRLEVSKLNPDDRKLWLSPVLPKLEVQMCQRLLDKIEFTPDKALGALRSYVEWAKKHQVGYWEELAEYSMQALAGSPDLILGDPECLYQAMLLTDSLLDGRSPSRPLIEFFLEGINAHSGAASLEPRILFGLLGLGTKLGLFARQPTSAQYIFDLLLANARLLDPRGVFKCLKLLTSSRLPPLPLPPELASLFSRVVQRGFDRIPIAERPQLREAMQQLDVPVSPHMEVHFDAVPADQQLLPPGRKPVDDLQPEMVAFLRETLRDRHIDCLAGAEQFVAELRLRMLTKPIRVVVEMLLSCCQTIALLLVEAIDAVVGFAEGAHDIEGEEAAAYTRQALAIARSLVDVLDSDILDPWVLEDARFQRLWISLLDVFIDGARHLTLPELGVLAYCTCKPRPGALHQPLVTRHLLQQACDHLESGKDVSLPAVTEFLGMLPVCKTILPLHPTVQAAIVTAITDRIESKRAVSPSELGDFILSVHALNLQLPEGIRKMMLRHIEKQLSDQHNNNSSSSSSNNNASSSSSGSKMNSNNNTNTTTNINNNLDTLLKIFTVLVPPDGEFDRAVVLFANAVQQMESSIGRYNPVGMLIYLISFNKAPLGPDGRMHPAIHMLCRRVENVARLLHPEEASILRRRNQLLTPELVERLLILDGRDPPGEPRPKSSAVPVAFDAAKEHLSAVHLLSEFADSFGQPNGSSAADALWCLEKIAADPSSLVPTEATNANLVFLYKQVEALLDRDPGLAVKIASFSAKFDNKRFVVALPEVRSLHHTIFRMLLNSSILDLNILLELLALADPPITDVEASQLVGALTAGTAKLGIRQTVACLHYLAALSRPLPETDMLIRLFWNRLLADPHKLRGSDFVKIFAALDRLDYRPTEAQVRNLAPAILEKVDTFSPSNLTYFWIALGQLGVFPGEDVFKALAPRSVKNLSKMHQHHRSDLLRAWLKLGIDPSSPEFKKIRGI